MKLRLSYKILRTVLVTIIIAVASIVAGLYVALSVPSVQNIIRGRAEKELTNLLGTPVTIGRISIAPFNSLTLSDVAVEDSLGVKALRVDRLGAGISLMKLFRGDIVVTYAEIIGLHATVYRDSPSDPLNIQPIIDRFKPKDKNKPPTRFSLAVNTIVIRRSSATYDVNSAPHAPEGHFSPKHIRVGNLRADVTLPLISNDRNIIDLRRLAFDERSGLTVVGLSGRIEFTPSSLSARRLRIEMPGSLIAFNDIQSDFGSLDNLRVNWRRQSFDISLKGDTYVTPSDLVCFFEPLRRFDSPVAPEIRVSGTPSDFDIERFSLRGRDLPVEISLRGRVEGLPDGPDAVTADISDLDVRANGPRVAELLAGFISLKPAVNNIISGLGDASVSAEAHLSPSALAMKGRVEAEPGAIELDGAVDRVRKRLKAHIEAPSLRFARMLPDIAPGVDGFAVDFDGAVRDMTLKLTAERVEFNNKSLENLAVDASMSGDDVEATVSIDGSGGSLFVDGTANIGTVAPLLNMRAELRRVNPGVFGIAMPGMLRGYIFDGDISADLTGRTPDTLLGEVIIDNFTLDAADGNSRDLYINRMTLTSSLADSTRRIIALDSPLLTARAEGDFRFATLGRSVRAILAGVNPVLFSAPAAEPEHYGDNIVVNVTLPVESPLVEFLKLPVAPLTPVRLRASLDDSSRTIDVALDAPYLRQGNKLIENTALSASFDGLDGRSHLQAYSLVPAKGGQVGLTITSDGIDSRQDTELSWLSKSGMAHGAFRFSAGFDRADDGRLLTTVDVNPGKIVFNDSVWNIAPSRISVDKKRINVDGFRISHADQLLSIGGAASPDSADVLKIELRDINLDFIFETLNINNVAFGGNATGIIYGRNLLTSAPIAYTPNLSVVGLSYNGAVMGDGIIESAWHPHEGAVTIDADISQANGHHSLISGKIVPKGELLDFTFDADKANVAFLRPFMSAFCDGITGLASGHARLWGTFHDLDMEGDVYGENLKMDLGLTGTSYWATDSVHIRRGHIDLKNITLRDAKGHTALLNGWLTHTNFHEPHFEFNITQARDLLAYDIKLNDEHPWYGKVYGNGSVEIKGRPGLVNINVDMSTAAGTDFTFVLDDSEVASDYDFLTFRDVTPIEKRPAAPVDTTPDLVRQLRRQVKKNDDKPSDYLMNFNIDVTPEAAMTLVMDPAGGDKIRATGSGTLTMNYGSANEDLRMYGTYVLNRGNYNFTFQDIILKDFTIEPGSSIAFHGDPYSAQLDIRAYYALNANLSDLDESFLQDRELNRTNVPVHAMLLVSGDMRRPDINFDLEFPTLTQDTYRKVRSIISTEEMMSRQIIYLLALNRFYTPEYMSATRGNELVSVASSTISSQLSSMLGQLSDKFSIAPSFRSDRGDFSDIEVDVALSSHLLNNRLLLNGNFGYRDKSLNNNSFIGDFDIEYLLNRSGSLRLKAYNRYNDQNYYLKSALTTQGVGIVYKRDFDDIFDWARRLRRRFNRPKTIPADTVQPRSE